MAVNVESHAMRYVEEIDGDEIWVTVPWGHHSGRIPPPIIRFHRHNDRELVYLYMGSKT